MLQQLRVETALCGRLSHPNIVRVYGCLERPLPLGMGVEVGLLLEYCPGEVFFGQAGRQAFTCPPRVLAATACCQWHCPPPPHVAIFTQVSGPRERGTSDVTHAPSQAPSTRAPPTPSRSSPCPVPPPHTHARAHNAAQVATCSST
jgi:hypothetical protein